MSFTLPTLPYKFDALEPFIDATTMEIHHDKHHATYVAKLNEALAKHSEIGEKTIEELLKNLASIPEDIRAAVRNHGGGHYNHSLFWTSMISGGNKVSGELAKAIDRDFGSFVNFQEKLTAASLGQFGSGWGWLVLKNKKLEAYALPNQDNPLSQPASPAGGGDIPLLGVDVWEHAYYLKYQNKRDEYLKAWWNIINWDEVSERYENAKR